MRGILELTVRKGDLEFLKYLVSNHSVDVNGELLLTILCAVVVLHLCAILCHKLLQSGLIRLIGASAVSPYLVIPMSILSVCVSVRHGPARY